MSEIVVNEESWPIVRIRFPTQRADARSLDALLARVEELAEGGVPHALLVDGSSVREAPSARQMMKFSRWSTEANARGSAAHVGTAIVLRASGARAVLSAYFWMSGASAFRIETFDELSVAERWCKERLVHAGVALSGGTPPANGAQTDPRPPTVPSRVEPAVEAHAPVIDMFREPAFVVDRYGHVIHQNEAARRAYPITPRWLGSVVSDAPASSIPTCRVLALDAEREIYLMIPSDSVRPRLEAPVEFSTLPPSLERVARLLALGMVDKDIAAELELPLSTVRTYVARVYARTGVSNRAQLASRLSGRGEPDPQ